VEIDMFILHCNDPERWILRSEGRSSQFSHSRYNENGVSDEYW